VQQEILTTIEITSTYDQISLLSFLFKKYEIKIIDTQYPENQQEKIKQKLQINQGLSEAFKQELFDKSKGQISF